MQVDPERCDSPTGQAGVSTALCVLHLIGVCFSLSSFFFVLFLFTSSPLFPLMCFRCLIDPFWRV